MRDQLNPANDLLQYLTEQQPSWTYVPGNAPIGIRGLPRPYLGVIRDITLYTDIPTPYGHGGIRMALTSLYPLCLDKLHVIFTGDRTSRLPYGCMKSFPSEYFINQVTKGEVNCRKVTFTIQTFLGEKTKATSLQNLIPKTNISYVMTIVEDEEGMQVEQAFMSESRFRPVILGN